MSLIFCLGFGPEPFPIPAAREPFFISKILSVTVIIYRNIYIYIYTGLDLKYHQMEGVWHWVYHIIVVHLPVR